MFKHGRLVTVLVSLLAGSAVVGVLPAAAGAASPLPLPACTYGDELTPQRAYHDWARTMLDTELKVRSTYVPPILVQISLAGVAGGGLVRPLVLDDLHELRLAARAAGFPIEATSAYRSFAHQKWLFGLNVARYGYQTTLGYVARPGHSEHQLGTALDLKAKGGRDPWTVVYDWATTPTGAWLKQNSWKFGFVVSYPKGKIAVTCYRYEPWHFRYFGREVARAIHRSGKTAREWLWAHGYGVS